MAVFETNQKQDFDLDFVYQALKRCKQKDEDVNIEEYLLAYHELCSFTALRWWSVYGSDLLPVCKFVRGLMMRSSVISKGVGGGADILAEAIRLQESAVQHSVSNLIEVSKQDQTGFFKLTGTLFGFVARDLEGKIKTIETRRKGDDGQHYNNVRSMLQYEVNKGISKDKGRLHSGSRTLLRLHWAFEFILEFMSRISNSTDHDKTSVIAAEVYAKTLSKHHPWITRKMAALAMYFLPSRKDLIEVMCKQNYRAVLEMLHQVVDVGKDIYDTTEKLYGDYDLLHIP